MTEAEQRVIEAARGMVDAWRVGTSGLISEGDYSAGVATAEADLIVAVGLLTNQDCDHSWHTGEMTAKSCPSCHESWKT